MFEQIGAKSFLNREHTGEYTEIEFDTYVEEKGEEQVIDITTPIHYYEEGEGEPLILVHGIGQTAYTWRKVFRELAQSFHVYAVDLPGHGFSGKPEIAYSVEEYALALEAFMNAKKIEAAHFCAFGESAVYVLDLAIHNPDRAKGLVLVSPVICSGGGLLKGRAVNSVFGALAGRMSLSPQVVMATLQDCYFDRTLVTGEVVEEYMIGFADKEFKTIAKLSMSNFVDDAVLGNLQGVASPVLVVAGLDDKISGGKDSMFLDLGFEKGNCLSVRNCGYLVQEEKPERLAEGIRAFLGAK